jgi:hypothetical protein
MNTVARREDYVAHQLLGLELEDGWKVIERLERAPTNSPPPPTLSSRRSRAPAAAGRRRKQGGPSSSGKA